MRHRHAFRKLNITDGAHRRSMLRHMGCALLLRESIRTTLPRAKELRRFVEPLITLGKKPSLHNRRLAFARLQNRQLVAKLFDDLGARFESRPGGYVRILKHGFRKGDNAPMAWVELTDKNPEAVAQAAADDLALAKKAAAKKSAKKSSKAGMMKSSDKAALEKLAAEAEAKDADSADDSAAADKDSEDADKLSAAAGDDSKNDSADTDNADKGEVKASAAAASSSDSDSDSAGQSDDSPAADSSAAPKAKGAKEGE